MLPLSLRAETFQFTLAGTAAGRPPQILWAVGLNPTPFSYDGQRIRRWAAGDWRGLEAILRFRVLGSLRVEAGSIVVPVTSPRQRAVLAVLLLHANRSVSAAELIGQVWGERHPASAGSLVPVSYTHLTLPTTERV